MLGTLKKILLFALLLVGCTMPATGEGRLTVYTAASLAEAFSELSGQFELANPGIQVALNVAGSQQLAHQISQGAPADVFASADLRQMANVAEAGRVRMEEIHIFARNRLVVIYPRENPGDLQKFSDLSRPDLKLIMAAAEVPAGQYALSVLNKAASLDGVDDDFQKAVLGNVVSFEENVRAVLSKVKLGEADGGLVYWSDLHGESTNSLGWFEVPEEASVVATYPIAAIVGTPQAEVADSFIRFLLAPDGQRILAQFGFEPVGSYR